MPRSMSRRVHAGPPNSSSAHSFRTAFVAWRWRRRRRRLRRRGTRSSRVVPPAGRPKGAVSRVDHVARPIHQSHQNRLRVRGPHNTRLLPRRTLSTLPRSARVSGVRSDPLSPYGDGCVGGISIIALWLQNGHPRCEDGRRRRKTDRIVGVASGRFPSGDNCEAGKCRPRRIERASGEAIVDPRSGPMRI